MGFDDWKLALAKVKDVHEPPGKQDILIAQQAHDAIDFIKSHDLVTIPKFCEETWRVQMLGIDGQKTMPYAAYGGLQLLAAYPRQDMKNDDKLMSLRGNNHGRFSAHRDRARIDSRPSSAGVLRAALPHLPRRILDIVLRRRLGALVLGDENCGIWVMRKFPKTRSGCCSGACTAARGSSSR